MAPPKDALPVKRRRVTMKSTAELLGMSSYAVRRIAKAYVDGGEEAVGKLHWGSGRPYKTLLFEQSEFDIMVSRETLNQQVGMSMNARAKEFTKRFKKPISETQLRELYRGRGVTYQLPQARLGPSKLWTDEEQRKLIKDLQEEVQVAIKVKR